MKQVFPEKEEMSRRALLHMASLAAVNVGLVGNSGQALSAQYSCGTKRAGTEDRNENRSLPRRRLGRTDMMVTTIGCGGAGITGTDILYRAIEQGINYIDTAPAYGDSEEVFGEVMRTARDQVFLATKWAVLSDWTVAQCLDSLHKSLKRLRTDRIDLLQLHSVDTGPGLKGTPRDGYARIDSPALHKAMEQARRQGKARFFGVSSHDPQRSSLLRHAIDTGLFDAIMVAFNAATYETSGMPALLAHAHHRDVGVIGMKASFDASPMKLSKVSRRRPSIAETITAPLAWMLTKDIHTVVHSETVFSTDSQDACLAAAGIKRK